jgi:hypothetical protein
MTGEPRPIFLGTIDAGDSGETIIFTVPLDADAATIAAAIERANAERAAAAARESKRLREIFLEADDR